MRFKVAARSETGHSRSNNEDAFAVNERFVVVSDGVGGRPAGEVASAIAVAALSAAVEHGVAVEDAIQLASDVVHAASESNGLLSGMCCTLTAVAIEAGGRVALGHVGDSKAWLVRDGVARQLTEDQTITARMVRDGELAPEEAATHPRRATLYQVVGSSKPLDVAVEMLDDVAPGDRLVLATDGLDYGGDMALGLLGSPLDGEALVTALVQAALDGGGNDNVTVVVADAIE